MALQDFDSLLFRPCYVRFLPATRPPTVLMLDEQMCRTDLPLRFSCVLGHVFFQAVHVGAFWWFPSRFFAGSVEEVGEVFRVRMADFPAGGETCVSLRPPGSARVLA